MAVIKFSTCKYLQAVLVAWILAQWTLTFGLSFWGSLDARMAQPYGLSAIKNPIMYVFCNQKLLTNIGTNKVRYWKYFEYNCTLNPDILVPISYTDACTISKWPRDMKIDCDGDGDDDGGDGGDVDHAEAFAFAISAMLVCLSSGWISNIFSWI